MGKMRKGRNYINKKGELVRTGVKYYKKALANKKTRKKAPRKPRKKVISKYYLVRPDEYHYELGEWRGRAILGIFRGDRLVIKMGLQKAIAICCQYEAISNFVTNDERVIFPKVN